MSRADSDLMYRLLVQGATDYAIYMLTPEGIVSNWNAGAQRAKGYKPNEIIGRHFSCLYMEEDRLTGLPDRGLTIAREQGRFEAEGWRLRKDGSRFWAYVVINPIRDDNGQFIGFAKITRDCTQQREEQAKSLEAERRFRILVQGITDYAIYMLEPDGTVANWNAGAERAKGYKSHEIVGKNFACFYSSRDRADGLPLSNLAIARAKGRLETEGWRLRKDGSRFWANVVIDAIYDDDGQLAGFAKITRDCTEQRKVSLALQASKNNLDRMLAHIVNGVCLIDADERVVTCNQQFIDMMSIDRSVDAIGKTLTNIFSEQVAVTIRKTQLLPASETKKPYRFDMVGRRRIIQTVTQALDGGGWVTTFEEITDRRRAEHRILHIAQHDSLTGLLNRLALLSRLNSMSSTEDICALIYLDLDRFKPVNDTLGHEAGDNLLKQVAQRLQGVVRVQDIVSRLGGDEFAILCSGRTGRMLAPRIAERILTELNRPFQIGDTEVAIGCSMGIAQIPDHADCANALLQNADLALYEAKRSGRNCFRFYDLKLTEKANVRQAMELRLRRALARKAFALYYQPVVAFETGAITGFEALIRWQDEDGEFIPPSDFIPLAEELGLMPELGNWILQKACHDAVNWPEHLTISVNVSPLQLQQSDFIETVHAALDTSGFKPNRLELEITETAMLNHMSAVRRTLEELRALNIQIALDDFGTGFSSLSFLQTLPFTRIKLDRSFVKGISVGTRAHAIVGAIIHLCGNLGINVTAEGIETPEERAVLASEQCNHFQGYLISPALPKEKLAPFLGSENVLRRAVS